MRKPSTPIKFIKPPLKPTPKRLDFLIEDGIPIPRSLHETGLTATLRKLKIGQSVFIPHLNSTAAIGGTLKNIEGRFTSRKVEGGGVRVWRIE